MTKCDETRRRILDAAATLFRRKGYGATTLEDIGRLAKLRGPAVYYYFKSKENLLEEVLNIGIERIQGAVLTAVAAQGDDCSHRVRIEAAVRAHLNTLLSHSDYTAANIVNYNLAPKKIKKNHLARREAYNDCWQRLLEQAQLAGEIAGHVDLRLLRLFLLSALFWTHEWYRSDQDSIEEMARKISATLFDGIS